VLTSATLTSPPIERAVVKSARMLKKSGDDSLYLAIVHEDLKT